MMTGFERWTRFDAFGIFLLLVFGYHHLFSWIRPAYLLTIKPPPHHLPHRTLDQRLSNKYRAFWLSHGVCILESRPSCLFTLASAISAPFWISWGEHLHILHLTTHDRTL
jgi:hypothetical protein